MRRALSIRLPWSHVICLLAVACVVTTVLFTRCCGEALAPFAWLLIAPYLLGSLGGGASGGGPLFVGFAAGVAIESA